MFQMRDTPSSSDPELVILLHRSPFWWRRSRAAAVLGPRQTAAVDESLVQALDDRSRLVRHAVGRALAERNTVRDAGPIMAALEHVSRQPRMRRELARQRVHDRERTAYLIIATGLAGVGALAIVDILSEALRVTAWRQKLYLRALGATKDVRALSAIGEVCDDQNAAVRAAAARAAAEIGGQGARLLLERMRHDEDEGVVQVARLALERLEHASDRE